MKGTTFWIGTIVAVGLLVVSLGHGFTLAQTPQYFFSEDFSGYEPGTQPSGWVIRNGSGDWGSVEIVEDPDLESKRALKLVSYLVRNQNFTVATPRWSSVSPDVTTIGYEYKVRVVDSRGVNAYITKAGSHKVVNGLGVGKLTYTDGSGWTDLAALPGGWNTVRIIANRVAGTADIYLNNVLVGQSTGLRNETDSWTDAHGYFLIATSDSESKEVLFGDLKAWVVK